MASTLFLSVSPASDLSANTGERVSAFISRLRENNVLGNTAGFGRVLFPLLFFYPGNTSLICRGASLRGRRRHHHMLLIPGLIRFIRLIVVTIFHAGYTRHGDHPKCGAENSAG